MQERQEIRGGLARAGFCLGKHILAVQGKGDDLGLDQSRGLVFLVRNGLKQSRIEAKLRKIQTCGGGGFARCASRSGFTIVWGSLGHGGRLVIFVKLPFHFGSRYGIFWAALIRL